MIPFLLPLTFSILLTLVFVISGSALYDRWTEILGASDEAMLWRVSSAVLTGSAILLPILGLLMIIRQLLNAFLLFKPQSRTDRPVVAIVLVVYIVSRLILLVEAFISLRHLTPEMLALDRWTTFIAHI